MSIEQKYIYNGALLTLQELHSAGVLLGNAQPEEATVYSDDAGALGTRYTSESDGIIVKSEGDIYYYATQAECDAEWTTEEPVQEIIAWTNTSQSLTTTSRITTNPNYQAVERYATLYNEQGKTFIFSRSNTYQITKWHDGTEWKDNDLLITAENHYIYPRDYASAKLGAYNTTIYASAFKYIER